MNQLYASASLIICFLASSCSSSGKQEISKNDKAQMYLDVAASDLNEGDATSALKCLKEAEILNPKSPELYYLFALTYFRKNEPGLAIRSAQKAIQLSPNFSAAKNALGKLLLDQGKTNEAEKYLKEAAQDLTFHEAFIAKTNLGLLYYKRLNHPEAERWFSKAILDGGENACMAAYYRGQMYLESNQLERAKTDFMRASKRSCSQFSDAHLAIGKTYLRMKKYDQARAKLLEVQQLFPSSDAAIKANDYLREIP